MNSRHKRSRFLSILLAASLNFISLAAIEFLLPQHSVTKILLFFFIPAFWTWIIFNHVLGKDLFAGKPDKTGQNKEADQIKQLKRLEKFRREYIGNVSHELKTPVFNIQGYLETLLENGTGREDWEKRFLKKALENTGRMNRIIRDLELIAENESEDLQLNLSYFNMAELMHEVFDAFQMQAQKQSVRLILDQPSCNKTVYADRKRIEQVLVNLVDNAIKYNIKNGEVKGLCKPSKNRLTIEISDTGIGIKKKHLTRIFERFYRVDKARSRKKGGSGLGLSIVKHILEAHQSTIHVESKPGKGSRFSFELPLDKG